MSRIIENPKTYEGRELETIFFRPMLTGPDALSLGVRMMYNMPVPTTLSLWRGAENVLKPYKKGFEGGELAKKYQKKIELEKVKCEIGMSAEDYFGMIYEQITNSPDVNLDDLTGTQLEAAETLLFRQAIAESIRRTMWLGDTSRASGYNTFNGFLKVISADTTGDEAIKRIDITDMSDPDAGETVLKNLWSAASPMLRALKADGDLVYLVTSDVYNNYEDSLRGRFLESAFAALQNGRQTLSYNGIRVIDVALTGVLEQYTDMPQSFALLTDRRNLALAVNTRDFPGTQVRMWYNPDEMENRQRAIFMAGCDYLMPELMTIATPRIETPTV